MKKVLVLGGAGFIGFHLCRRLLAEDCHVIALDNFSSGSRSNIQPLGAHPHFEPVSHDVSTPFHFEAEEIYHLASPASPVHVNEDPVKALTTNIWGTIHALNLAEKTGAKILLASTSEVYGYPLSAPQAENYLGNVNPADPRACYYEAKRCAEALLLDCHRRKHVRVKIVRIFNAYGPQSNPRDGRVMANFILQALHGDPITLHGDGSQIRSFCYIDDLIEGFMLMMQSQDTFTGPVNLGNPETSITMLELARLICSMTGSTSAITHKAAGSTSPAQLCPDITYARTALHWVPRVLLPEGLDQTIRYFREECN